MEVGFRVFAGELEVLGENRLLQLGLLFAGSRALLKRNSVGVARGEVDGGARGAGRKVGGRVRGFDGTLLSFGRISGGVEIGFRGGFLFVVRDEFVEPLANPGGVLEVGSNVGEDFDLARREVEFAVAEYRMHGIAY